MGTTANDQIEKIKNLIESINVGMMITKETTGGLKGRPMGTAKVEDDGSLWFFTNEYTSKVDDISHNSEVYITYASPSKNSYLTLNGQGELNDDRTQIEALWNPSMKAWFPEGLDDPKIMLIKVTPVEAEYWDGSSNKIIVAYHMLKAAVTGKHYDDGEHGKVQL